MLMVRVTYFCKPDCRDAFVKALQEEEIPARTRREEGNLEYTFSLPLGQENAVALLERWESGDCLKSHRTQPHLLRLRELKAQYVEHSEIRFYDVQPRELS